MLSLPLLRSPIRQKLKKSVLFWLLPTTLLYEVLLASPAPLAPKKEIPYSFWSGHNVRMDYGMAINAKWTKVTNQMLELGYEYGWVVKQNKYIGIDLTWNLWYPRTINIFKNAHKNALRRAEEVIEREKDPQQKAPTQFENLVDFVSAPLGRTPAGLVLMPMPHLYFGYITPNKTLLTLGTAYLWGLMGTIRSPLSDHFFFETKVVWWLDSYIGEQRIDGLYFTAGIGYHF